MYLVQLGDTGQAFTLGNIQILFLVRRLSIRPGF